MSQNEVIKLLEKTEEWMTSKEIFNSLDVGRTNIQKNLKRIFETTNEIDRKQELQKYGGFMFLWRIKRGKKEDGICVQNDYRWEEKRI